jgi:hypothetical protein
MRAHTVKLSKPLCDGWTCHERVVTTFGRGGLNAFSGSLDSTVGLSGLPHELVNTSGLLPRGRRQLGVRRQEVPAAVQLRHLEGVFDQKLPKYPGLVPQSRIGRR